MVVGKDGKSRVKVLSHFPEKLVEKAARTCYKSDLDKDGNPVPPKKMTVRTARKFIKMLRKCKHDAMLEFGDIIIRLVTDRGVSHEMVRMRLCSFAQESTRYCDYSRNKHGKEITVIRPHFKHPAAGIIWERLQKRSEEAYFALRALGEPPELARSVLTNSLKTELVVKANTREWAWIKNLRAALTAHPQMREVMAPVVNILMTVAPSIFEEMR